jgi:O-antigen/teichoic acid export membrane protein
MSLQKATDASGSSFRNIARNIGLFGGAQSLTVLAALVRGKAASVLIGPVGVGLSGLYTTIVNFYVSLTGFGLTTSGVPAISEAVERGDLEAAETETRYLRMTCLWTMALAWVAIFCTMLVMALVYHLEEATVGYAAALIMVVWMRHAIGCEMAILKAYRCVRQLMWMTVISALISVVCIVPFYYGFGLEGIVPAIVISTVVDWIQTLCFSHQVAPMTRELWASCFSPDRRVRIGLRRLWQRMRPIILVGVSTIVSGLMVSGVELWTQSLIAASSMLAVGLYRAGYQLSITYPSMIFTSIGNDFYPRLAGIGRDVAMRNRLVTRQMLVTCAIVVPMTAAFAWLMPYLVPLFFSHKFDDLLPMALWSCWTLPIKALSLPLAYLPLALGKWRDYLGIEVTVGLVMAACVTLGWHQGGLAGTGVGLLVAFIVELAVNYLFCRWRYGFRLRLD